jgi:peptidoglycan/xylan/chitin deacetylase (PgdA/CDA1 family)
VKETLKGLARRAGLHRTRVASARVCCERNLLARVGRRPNRDSGRILCYHSVGQPLWGVNDVSPHQFRRHLELALSAGFRIVPASEIVRTGGGPRDLAITFDDGLRSVLTNAAPILADYGVPWSLFVVSDWTDQRHPWGNDVMLSWNEVEQLMAAGAEIGSHSVTHPDFRWLGASEAADELEHSRRTIEQRLGIAPSTFAIPMGQSANWTAGNTAAARAAGYETIFAQAEETRPAETVARTFVTCWDSDRVFQAALGGAFDRWEEWV